MSDLTIGLVEKHVWVLCGALFCGCAEAPTLVESDLGAHFAGMDAYRRVLLGMDRSAAEKILGKPHRERDIRGLLVAARGYAGGSGRTYAGPMLSVDDLELTYGGELLSDLGRYRGAGPLMTRTLGDCMPINGDEPVIEAYYLKPPGTLGAIAITYWKNRVIEIFYDYACRLNRPYDEVPPKLDCRGAEKSGQ